MVAVLAHIVQIIVLSTSTYALNQSQLAYQCKLCGRPTFWESVTRFHVAAFDCGSTVPKKIALNWFIPAFVKSSVGSDSGTTDDEGTEQPR